MPNFNIDDVFCLPAATPTNGSQIDMSGSTVLDGSNLFTVNTTGANNYALIEPGTSSFNGFSITEAGSMKAQMEDCGGNIYPDSVPVIWFSTTDGNTYYMLPDDLGDYVVDTINVIDTGTGSAIGVGPSFDENDDQKPCVCFAAEMLIDTQAGPVPAGDLKIGDAVLTKDKGYQLVRWVYKREVLAKGANTPVLFKKGSIGNTKDLIVSQKHRFFTGTLPQSFIKALANHDNHLVHAEQFVNGVSIRLMPEVKTVTYVHIMFEDHELVHCQGTVSESWQPTRKALQHAPEVEMELLELFPEIKSRSAVDPGCMVRPELVFALKSTLI